MFKSIVSFYVTALKVEQLAGSNFFDCFGDNYYLS